MENITVEFFGKKLKIARKRNGLSQNDLAHKLHVTPTTINFYEKGHAYPTLDKFTKICTILDVCPDYFLSSSDDLSHKSLNLNDGQMESVMKFVSLIEEANKAAFLYNKSKEP